MINEPDWLHLIKLFFFSKNRKYKTICYSYLEILFGWVFSIFNFKLWLKKSLCKWKKGRKKMVFSVVFNQKCKQCGKYVIKKKKRKNKKKKKKRGSNPCELWAKMKLEILLERTNLRLINWSVKLKTYTYKIIWERKRERERERERGY